ncbi:Candidapepsin-2 [Yarrowia sp. B02]|nr:Candidapepsin-2 [Yarrowia sp. B02]
MLFSNVFLASVAAAGVVHMPLSEREYSDEQYSNHLAARGILHGTQKKGARYYEAELEVGTPSQKVRACFDTGSPFLWLKGANSSECLAHKNCDSSFNVSQSSTWRYQSHGLDAWNGEGNWGTETVSYVGVQFEEFDTWVSTGITAFALSIFGQRNDENPKKSFVHALANAGKISRTVFSLNAQKPVNYLDQTTEGVVNNVYYGGFDRAKYQGALTSVKCDSAYKMPIGAFSIQGSKIATRPYSTILDSGTDLLQLPNSTVEAVSKKFGGNGDYEDGKWKVACDSRPEISYEWGDTSIAVDLSAYVTSSNGNCHLEKLMVMSDDTADLLTGTPLISRALVIYDSARELVTVAQARYTDESDVVEITGDIPGAVLFADSQSSASTTASKTQSTTLAVQTASATQTSSSAPQQTSEAPASDPFSGLCGLIGLEC